MVRDPSPIATEFSAEACDFLVAHPAPFRKFTETFLCLVGLSRYYDLDHDVYPTFLTSTGEGGCFLLDSIVGRVIPFDDQAGPVVRVGHCDQNDNVENVGHDDPNRESGDAD
ncbi:hypothetical protein Tco_1187177 [Tanacetum coccineum]